MPKIYEINKGSKLMFEAPFTIPSASNLSTLKFVDILATGYDVIAPALSYTKGTAKITYNGVHNIRYWDETAPTPTVPYYTDSSDIITEASDDDGKFKINLEIFDPTTTKEVFNPSSDVEVVVQVPVLVNDIPKVEGTDTVGNYFTNAFSLLVDGSTISSSDLNIYFAPYRCAIYGGEVTVDKVAGKDVVLKSHIPTMSSKENNIVYTFKIVIDPSLGMITTPTKTADQIQIDSPLATPGYVYLRYDSVDGELVPISGYTVTADTTTNSITFKINHQERMKESYIYVFAQTKIANDSANTPIKNELYLSVDLTTGTAENICKNTLAYNLVNLKSTVTVKNKIIL